MSVRKPITIAAGLGLILWLAGCNADPNRPKLGKVHGKVTYNGKPVDHGRILFTPAAGKGGETGQVASGEIDSNGNYELTTFDTGDGAILGQHIVTVVVSEKGNEDMGKPDEFGRLKYVVPKAVTPNKYATADKSPLRCTVEEGTKAFDIDLKD